MQHAIINTKIGEINIITRDGYLLGVFFPTEKHSNIIKNWPYQLSEDVAGFGDKIAKQIESYINGENKKFDIPYRFEYGTDLEQKTWEYLKNISYGETTTYARVAEAIGSPKAIRAVASAIGRNPISIVLPCHRVLGSDGRLRGYAGGVKMKEALLRIEGITNFKP